MIQILAALRLAIIAWFALSPFLFYRKSGLKNSYFYIDLAAHTSLRLIYRVTLGLHLLIVNVLTLMIDGFSLWQAPAIILTAVIMPDCWTAAILRRLHDDRRAQLLSFSLFFISMAIPELFSFSATLGMLIIGAMFYPSWMLTQYIRGYRELKDKFPPTSAFITQLYYRSKRASGPVSFPDP